MTNIIPIITNAGMNAIFQTEGTDFNVNISHVALGDVGGGLDGAITTLNNEVCRHEIAYSQRLNNNQLHIATNITGAVDFWIREIGIYLDDGTLFAYWTSDTDVFAFKSANVDLLLSLNFMLSNVPANKIEVINSGEFALPFATDTSAGIVSENRISDISTSISTNLINSAITSTLTGSITAFGGEVIPDGWLLCDGAELDRVLYASLFDAVGIYHGGGDGVDTFNIPDLRGEFIRGFDNGRGIDVDRVFGNYQAGTKITGENGSTSSRNNHTIHNINNCFGDPVYESEFDTTIQYNIHAGNIVNSNGAHWWATVRPRNIALNYIIKY